MSGIFDQIINYSPPLIVSGTVNYKGTWNASTNNPTLNNPPAASTKGDYYVVSTAGTQFSISFAVGDWIISSGTAWEKVDLTDAVSSVFGRTGAVVGVSTDYSAVGLTNTAIGAANPSTGAFTTISATTPIAVASGGTGVSTSTGTTNVVLSNNPTIVTPVIAQINDANGNSTLRLTGITSATDYLEIKNGIGVGSPLHVLAEGASTNIGVHLQPKGSGLFTISDGTDFNKGIRFRSSSSAASAVTLIDAVSTAGRVVTLPDATGTLLYGGGPLGTPSSGTVTNLTGTASININGTVGATTPSTVAATTGTFSGTLNQSSSSAFEPQFIQTGSAADATSTYFIGRKNRGGAAVQANDTLSTVLFQGWDGTAYDDAAYISATVASVSGGHVAGQLNFVTLDSAGVSAQRAIITSTGLNSTAIGATTPSTIAATTATTTGNVGIRMVPDADASLVIASSSTIAAGRGSLRISGSNNTERIELQSTSSTGIVGFTFSGTVASPTATTSGQSLIFLGGGGYDNTPSLVLNKAVVNIAATENWTTTAQGTAISFLVTPNGSTTRSTVATVSSTGLQVTGALSSTGALAIGNTVASAVAVASTHKVTIVIGGVTYYLLATNV